jgi:hypothetical protein
MSSTSKVELEVHRVDVEFGAGFSRWTHVLLLNAVSGFWLLIFTAELVASAAKPPTAFSNVQETFPTKSGVLTGLSLKRYNLGQGLQRKVWTKSLTTLISRTSWCGTACS